MSLQQIKDKPEEEERREAQETAEVVECMAAWSCSVCKKTPDVEKVGDCTHNCHKLFKGEIDATDE